VGAFREHTRTYTQRGAHTHTHTHNNNAGTHVDRQRHNDT
jgi:hypothetical protein